MSSAPSAGTSLDIWCKYHTFQPIITARKTPPADAMQGIPKVVGIMVQLEFREVWGWGHTPYEHPPPKKHKLVHTSKKEIALCSINNEASTPMMLYRSVEAKRRKGERTSGQFRRTYSVALNTWVLYSFILLCLIAGLFPKGKKKKCPDNLMTSVQAK